MESGDVIELGSSEDETEPPAAKKIKPLPNAMVHIPNKLRGITITPVGSNRNKVGGKFSRDIKVPKSTTINSISITRKPNGRHLQKNLPRSLSKKHGNDKSILFEDKLKVNPMSIISQCALSKNKLHPAAKQDRAPFKVQTPKGVTVLPRSLTVTKTNVSNCLPKIQSVQSMSESMDLTTSIGDVLTVELDDEGSQSSTATASPQWYLRPEEETKENNSLQIQNNTEPEPNMIEITIEDSPVKPCIHKEQSKLSDSIIIEDSPIKPVKEIPSGCDEDIERKKINVPVSKKKLDYPEETECQNLERTEENHKVDSLNTDDIKADTTKVDSVCINESSPPTEVSCIKETPKTDILEPSTTKSEAQQPAETPKTPEQTQNEDKPKVISEFHPTYQKFIDLCFELENTDDMRKIVDKKIKTYYKQVSKVYVESEEFLSMVSIRISLMKAGPEKMYLYIKDIVDELNLQRKMAKTQAAVNFDTSSKEKSNESFDEGKFDRKRRKQIRKLDKTIRKLHRAIQKLEEQEVDFDDEEDSVYLLTERYKERLVRVYAKLCKITNTRMPSEPHIHIQCRAGQPPGPAKRLEKWINKKVPLGAPLPFPDFHDVLKCVRQANEEDRLGWNEADVMEEARDLFTRCGRKLQRRRQENEWRLATSRITQDEDPAEQNETLKKRLDENKLIASKKETELVNRFADKQNQLKLEGVEIGDKEAEESPVESEDEEVNDDSNSLENKQKRKDRLRRLLEEKSKKAGDSNDKAECLCDNNEASVDILKLNNEDKSVENDCRDVENSNIQATANEQTIPKVAESADNSKSIDEVIMESCSKQNSPERDKISIDVTFETDESTQDSKEPNILFEVKKEPQSSFENNERINLVSDDSDVEELNLLQKLQSDDMSSAESSDCDSTIAISDTVESNSECDNNEVYDVISIENSSYSESEAAKDESSFSELEIKSTVKKEHNILNLEDEAQYVESQESLVDKENFEELNEDSENILLASSGDEDCANKDTALSKTYGNYINLKDDEITIGESQLQGVKSTKYVTCETVDLVIPVSGIPENNCNNIKLNPCTVTMQPDIQLIEGEENSIESVDSMPAALKYVDDIAVGNAAKDGRHEDDIEVQLLKADLVKELMCEQAVNNDIANVPKPNVNDCSSSVSSSPTRSPKPAYDDSKTNSVEMLLEAMFSEIDKK